MKIALFATVLYAIMGQWFLWNALIRSDSLSAFVFLFMAMILAFFQSIKVLKGTLESERFYGLRFEMKPVLAVWLGTVLTYLLSSLTELGSIAASSLVGMAAGVFFIPHSLAVFCGSFIGMSSPELFSFFELGLAGLIGGFIYCCGSDAFEGMGGKLGATAFMGSWMMFVIVSNRPGKEMFIPYNQLNVNFDMQGWLWFFTLCALGSALTYYLVDRFRVSPVLSAGFVGLIGVILFLLFPHYMTEVHTAGIYSAAFAGMCSKKLFSNVSFYFILGIVTGGLYMAVLPVFNHLGGKLGMTAFMAVLIVQAAINIRASNRNVFRFLKN